MRARLLALLRATGDAFWVLPAVVVAIFSGLGWLIVMIQQQGLSPTWLPDGWAYGGGETGARTLLGAIATSTIGVAGTIFSVTIAALTLASNQMGPRLLRNFTRDRGNQWTLGVLLGTFAYALIVLRSVRGGVEETFVPSLGVSVGLALSAACVAMLIYFIHHVAARINVEVVIDLVHADLDLALDRLTFDSPPPQPPRGIDWDAAEPVATPRSGYLKQVDEPALARWAAKQGATVRLLFRRGDFVFPGTVFALTLHGTPEIKAAITRATAFGESGAGTADPLFALRQLVEVGLRALSPSLNDPLTAMKVLDRLGASLARIADRHMPTGAVIQDERVTLMTRTITYDELVSAMFGMMRQSAGDIPPVLIHLLNVLGAVATVERRADALESLRQLAESVVDEGRRAFRNPRDLGALESAHRQFLAASANSEAAHPMSAIPSSRTTGRRAEP